MSCNFKTVGEVLRNAYVVGVDEFDVEECESLGIEGLNCDEVVEVLADGIVKEKERDRLVAAGLSRVDIVDLAGENGQRALKERVKWLADNCTREEHLFGLIGYDAFERRTMIDQLRETGSAVKDAVPALLEAALKDCEGSGDNFETRKAAINALEEILVEIEDGRIVPALAEAARTNYAAVYALGVLAAAGNMVAADTMRSLNVDQEAKQYTEIALAYLVQAGNEEAFEALTRMARTTPCAVFELATLANEGNTKATDAMRSLDVDYLITKIAEGEWSLAVSTLERLAAAGNEAAANAMRTLDVDQIDLTDDMAVHTLESLVAAGNEAAANAMRTLDADQDTTAGELASLVHAGNEEAFGALTRMARTNPDAVSVLENLAAAGNVAAANAMKSLNVRQLAVMTRTNCFAISALAKLALAGNEEALGALIGVAGSNPDAVSALRDMVVNRSNMFTVDTAMPLKLKALKALASMDVEQLAEKAETAPHAVSALRELADGGNAEATNAMRSLDVHHLAGMAEAGQFAAVDALGVLAAAGNTVAADAMRSLNVDQINLTTDGAVFALEKLAKNGNMRAADTIMSLNVNWFVKKEKVLELATLADAGNVAAASAMRSINADQLVRRRARGDLSVTVIMLRNLAERGNAGATDAMRSLDGVNQLVGSVRRGLFPFAMEALTSLVHAKNEKAFKALIMVARTVPAAVDALEVLAAAGNTVAADTMRSLDVSRLAVMSRTSPPAICALGKLAGRRNAAASKALLELEETGPRDVEDIPTAPIFDFKPLRIES